MKCLAHSLNWGPDGGYSHTGVWMLCLQSRLRFVLLQGNALAGMKSFQEPKPLKNECTSNNAQPYSLFDVCDLGENDIIHALLTWSCQFVCVVILALMFTAAFAAG